jgi:hypothetical protein
MRIWLAPPANPDGEPRSLEPDSEVTNARRARRLVAAFALRDARPARRVTAHLPDAARVLPAHHADGRLDARRARRLVTAFALRDARPARRVTAHLPDAARVLPTHRADRHLDARRAWRLVTALARGDARSARRVTAHLPDAARVLSAHRAHGIASASLALRRITRLPLGHADAAADVAAGVTGGACRDAAALGRLDFIDRRRVHRRWLRCRRARIRGSLRHQRRACAGRRALALADTLVRCRCSAGHVVARCDTRRVRRRDLSALDDRQPCHGFCCRP